MDGGQSGKGDLGMWPKDGVVGLLSGLRSSRKIVGAPAGRPDYTLDDQQRARALRGLCLQIGNSTGDFCMQ